MYSAREAFEKTCEAIRKHEKANELYEYQSWFIFEKHHWHKQFGK